MADSSNPSRYSGPEVREYRSWAWSLMPKTRAAATEARDLLAGNLGIALPETVTLAGADAWVGDLPHKKTGPQRIRQKLIAKEWEIKRPVTSGGPRAASVATRISEPLHAIEKDERAGYPWEMANDLLLIEGIGFSTMTVDSADWRKSPLLYKEGSPSLDVAHMEARFAIDAAGKFRGDEGYDASTVNVDQALKDLTAERHDRMARHLPFKTRALSIRTCAPIWGDGGALDGLVVETTYTAPSLRRGGIYVSNNKDGSDAQLYPLGAAREGDSGVGAVGRPITVTELWLYDDDGIPYISYHVEGYDYAWTMGKDGPQSHIVDLSKLCQDKQKKWHGFTRLPISYGFGLGWSTTDMDQRALPFTKPFQQSWRNIDSLITAIVSWCQWRAFPALIEKVSLAEMSNESLDEEERVTPDILPMKITRVTGDVTEIATQGIQAGVFSVIDLMLGENKKESPGGEQGGAPSGFAQTISEALESDALTTVNKAAMKMLSQDASYKLEAAKILGECFEPIRVYQIADVLIEQKSPSSTDQILVLDPGLIGSSYDVKAVVKRVPGENPALRQQNAALVKEGFYDTRWYLEQDGYPAPEEMAMRVAWEELLKSDEGKKATLNMLQSYVENKYVEQIQQAIADGQANQQGLPTGYGDGTSPPPGMQQPGGMLPAGPQATGGMVGMGTPNPAAASLAGVVVGGMQTGPVNHALAAGGQLPQTALNGAARP